MKIKTSVSIDKDLLLELKQIQKETGICISRQIELSLKNYKIVKES